MKRHFCPMDHTWIEYEDECNWCGEKEMSKTEDDYDDLWNREDSPWGPTDDDSWGDYKHDEWKQQELDDERDSDSK